MPVYHRDNFIDANYSQKLDWRESLDEDETQPQTVNSTNRKLYWFPVPTSYIKSVNIWNCYCDCSHFSAQPPPQRSTVPLANIDEQPAGLIRDTMMTTSTVSQYLTPRAAAAPLNTPALKSRSAPRPAVRRATAEPSAARGPSHTARYDWPNKSSNGGRLSPAYGVWLTAEHHLFASALLLFRSSGSVPRIGGSREITRMLLKLREKPWRFERVHFTRTNYMPTFSGPFLELSGIYVCGVTQANRGVAARHCIFLQGR